MSRLEYVIGMTLVTSVMAFAIAAFILFIYAVVAAPMMANYSECGTIFLCANQAGFSP